MTGYEEQGPGRMPYYASGHVRPEDIAVAVADLERTIGDLGRMRAQLLSVLRTLEPGLVDGAPRPRAAEGAATHQRRRNPFEGLNLDGDGKGAS